MLLCNTQSIIAVPFLGCTSDLPMYQATNYSHNFTTNSYVYNYNFSPLSEDTVEHLNQKLNLNQKLKCKYRELANEWQKNNSRKFQVNTRLVRLKDSASEALKLIDYSTRLETVEEFEDDVENISPNKAIDLISSVKPGTCVSVSGPRGIGKSTFIRRMCHCWATGYKLRKYELLLWIDLCTAPSKPYNKYTKLLSASLYSSGLPHDFKIKSSKLLVVLDHYSNQWKKISEEMIKKKITVVVISWKPVRLMQGDMIYIHLLGLTDEQISRQVLHYYQNNHSRAEHFLQYLSSVPNFSYLKRVPVYLFGLLAVFDHTSTGHPPHNLTSFLSCLALMMVNVDDNKLDELAPERIYNVLDKLPLSSRSLFHKICQKVYVWVWVDTQQKQSVVLKHELGDFDINSLLMEPCLVALQLQPGQWLQLTSFPLLNDFLTSLHLCSLPQPSDITVIVLKFHRELVYFCLYLMPHLKDELVKQTSHSPHSLSYCYDDGVEVDCGWDTPFHGLLTSKDMYFLRTLGKVQLHPSCHFSLNGLTVLLSCSATSDMCQLVPHKETLKHLR